MTDSKDAQAIDDLVRINKTSADTVPGHAGRAQHRKDHGCVAARFIVDADVPADLRAGIFATPGAYDALIRYSNSSQADDRKADVHGMAIKVLGVPGEKLVDHEGAVDFLLIDSEVFFTGDPQAYILLSHALIERGAILSKVFAWIRVLLFNLPLLLRAKGVASQKPNSPLASTYHSAVPYALGDAAVKYVATPRVSTAQPPISGPDGLATALVAQLANGAFEFDFAVDVQIDASAQPIEDPTRKWSAAPGARRVRLARIEIPAQAAVPTSALAENLAFSPWHTLAAHRPLGFINRARSPIYHDLAAQRRRLNSVDPSTLPGGGERP